MQTNNLKFFPNESYTPSQFKKEMGVDEILIKKSTTGEKHFFQFGAKTGVVSSKFGTEAFTKPMISKVQGDPSEQNPSGVFFLLHQQGEGGAAVVATL